MAKVKARQNAGSKAAKGKKRRAEDLLEKEDDRDEFFLGSDVEAGSDAGASDADEVEETAAEKRLRVGEQHVPHHLASANLSSCIAPCPVQPCIGVKARTQIS